MQRVLITGASRGLGLGLATAYAERGDRVIGVCRTSTPALAALGAELVEGVELSSDDAVARLAGIDGPVDVVVCNAAVNIDAPGLDSIVMPDLSRTLEINALGAVRTVLALLPRLKPGAKICLVSSGGLAPLNLLPTYSVGNYGYRMAKSALISFGHGLARDVRERGISVAILSPGPTNTDQLRAVHAQGRTSLAPEDAADPVAIGRMFRDRMDALTLDQSPLWLRTPEGEPAIAAEVMAVLRP